MAVEPSGWTGFSGGDGDVCELSSPTINGATDLDCHGAASVALTVTGGIGPYSWVTTLGNLSDATGSSTTLTPPANPYSGAAGTSAYGIGTKNIGTFCGCLTSIWDCYGDNWQTCLGINSCWTGSCLCNNCATAADAVCDSKAPYGTCGKSACSGVGCPEDNAHHFCVYATGDCQPCAVTMNGGAVVTVTDSLGQTAFVSILPTPRSTL